MKIAIVCAMQQETAILKEQMTNVTTKELAGVTFTEGGMHMHEIVLCISGIGKANAAATTQLVICTYAPDVLINIGLAGSCTTALPLGGAVVADHLIYHDIRGEFVAEGPPGMAVFVPDTGLMALAQKACGDLGIVFVKGTVATGDAFIESTALRDDIVLRTNCACVEMEAAAVAHIAHKNNVRYTVVKIMSDNADEGAMDTFHDSLPLGAYCDRSVGIISHIVRNL